MKGIFVSVKVPGSGRTFEICISGNLKIHELTQLLIQAFDNLTDEDFNPVNSILCDGKMGKPFDINMAVSEVGITNGTELLLI